MEAATVRSLPVTQALETLRFLHPDGGVFEICALKPHARKSPLWEGDAFGRNPIIAGWFKDPEKAAQLAVKLQADGVYVILNPCDDALLGRADHKLKAGVDRTADDHITRIQNILIDIDPSRVSGVSSTDEQHDAALEVIQMIRLDLGEEGWPDPLTGDSGNGGHNIYAVDLPNTPESKELIKAILVALSARYAKELEDKGLSIDLSVFNPARLSKVYGTMTHKGDNTKDRPHRMAQIITIPQTRQAVPPELLKKLAATVPQEEKPPKINTPKDTARLDVEAYQSHYGISVVKVKPHAGGQLFCLEHCLFDPTHAGGEAAIFQSADGVLSYKCFHDSCQGHTWAEARQIISGDDKLTPFMVGGAGNASNNKKLLKNSPLERVLAKVENALKSGGLTADEITNVLNLIK
jgi:hypothetical protein